MAEGNRKDPRARVLNMTVRYKSATVDEFIENHSHDISKGGIFIKTRAPFPAGTLLKFEVRIAEDQRLMQGVGRVVWRREPERAEDGFPAGMGIKFIKTGEGAAELISQIIAAREGEESSFDAGARENGELPASDPGRRSGAPAAAEAASVPHFDAPALHVESGPPGSLPVEGEFRVSSPPKKRAAASETRKVVLQGAAAEAPASDKTPLSAPARAVTAQLAVGERAPSRPVTTGRNRASIVDETTAPRARSASEAKASSSSPSVYGLVAILGLVALTLLFVKLARDPEPEAAVAPPPPTTNTSPAVVPPPIAPLPSEPPSAAVPAGETGEGAGEPVAAAEPTAAPAAESPAPAAAAPAAGAGASPARAPNAAAPSPAPPAAPKPAPSATASAPQPPPAAAPAPPPAAATPPPTKPKVVAKPAAPSPPTEPTLSIRPAAPEASPTAPGSEATGSEQRPAEPAKKRPPAAAAPAEPEPKPAPAPSPKPSDDNPY